MMVQVDSPRIPAWRRSLGGLERSSAARRERDSDRCSQEGATINGTVETQKRTASADRAKTAAAA